MKKILYLFILIPGFIFSQFKEISKDKNNEIGKFYDEKNNAPFTLSKTEKVFSLCFFNEINMDSETQMVCLKIDETESSMNDFYLSIKEIFSKSTLSLEKKFETKEYFITAYKFGNFIELKIIDKNEKKRNNYFLTCNFSLKNWNQLFNKKN